MQTKQKTKNECIVELNIDLGFIAKVDMTEFNEQSIKVDEIATKRTEFVGSQLPIEKVKDIIEKAQSDITALGLDLHRNITVVETPNPLRGLTKMLGAMLSGSCPPPDFKKSETNE